eukprot:717042-Prorocentrum_minimum.AAC.2
MCVECSHWVVDWTRCGSQARLQKECLREEAEARKRQEEVQALDRAKEQAEAERLKKVRLFRRHERPPPDTGRSNDLG